jgi:hypothetical protein
MLKVLISLTSAIIIFGTTTSISYAAGSQSGHFIAEMDRDRTARSRERSFYRMQAAPPKGSTRSALSIVSIETTMIV